jgi:hypothetical protein
MKKGYYSCISQATNTRESKPSYLLGGKRADAENRLKAMAESGMVMARLAGPQPPLVQGGSPR